MSGHGALVEPSISALQLRHRREQTLVLAQRMRRSSLHRERGEKRPLRSLLQVALEVEYENPISSSSF